MIERMRMDKPVAPQGPQYASQVHGQGAAGAAGPPTPAHESWPQDPSWGPPLTDEGGWMAPVSGVLMPAVEGAAEDAGKVSKPRGRKYWTLWISGMVSIGVVVGVALVLLMKLVNGPVSAGATPDSLEAARAAVSPTPATNTISGKSVELSYPSVFDAVANKSNDPGAKGDQYYLSTKSQSNRSMVVTAFVLASRKLEDDSSYKFRSMHPELYKASKMKFGKEEGVIMSRVDKTEVTFFWVHGDRDLNIALTSTDPKDDLAGWMQAMIPTIRWKQ